MLTRAFFAVISFGIVAYGGPLVGRNPQCNTGSLQCCNSVQEANSDQLGGLLSLLSIPMEGTGQVGVTCSPIPVAGAGSGSTCQANPVCCSGTSHYNGLVNMGCDPVNVVAPL
ncbi:hypothetical protein PAXRUDRAFT_149767 [Paxillus rubicundulus Ve08.2h10]|uniref:Hydrophobin n=1 Tax=Paxillus rubicundulus Ve08.2h10 TaxID=930991 RepID=A0A0D0E310_9AGAM|nr:hypothetical protein PAXRUDRAFT_149767 [Paxillus rubicundulus Ve08.2h10]